MVSGRETPFWTIAKRSISESLNMSIGTYLYMNGRKSEAQNIFISAHTRVQTAKPPKTPKKHFTLSAFQV